MEWSIMKADLDQATEKRSGALVKRQKRVLLGQLPAVPLGAPLLDEAVDDLDEVLRLRRET